jgi:hypothetical protein
MRRVALLLVPTGCSQNGNRGRQKALADIDGQGKQDPISPIEARKP